MRTEPSGMVRRLDACRQLGIQPRTAHEWAGRKYGPLPRRVGGRVYYLQTEIDEFLATVKARPSVVA